MISNCQLHLLLQLTNMYETSSLSFDYPVCVTLQDNHGFSAGIVQFNTGSGSAIQVIQGYNLLLSPNEFTPLNASLSALLNLEQTSSSLQADTASLPNFCKLWATASKNVLFQNSQVNALSDLYLSPAMGLASKYSLQSGGKCVIDIKFPLDKFMIQLSN